MNDLRRKHRLTPAATRPCLRVLAVGDIDHPDFAVALATLEAESELTRLSPSSPTPAMWDLLLVCQSRPGSVDRESLVAGDCQNPLAGRFALLGSWCEGETRTGQPLSGLTRLFWYQFPSWWKLTHAAWVEGRPTDWHWPVERVTQLPETPARADFVAVVSPDYASASSLIDLFKSVGGTACWCPEDAPWPKIPHPTASIWIGGMLLDREEVSLRRTRAQLPPDVPLVVLLDFPRREAVITAMRLGATAVLGKPWRVDQLLAALQPGFTNASVGGQEVAEHDLGDHQ